MKIIEQIKGYTPFDELCSGDVFFYGGDYFIRFFSSVCDTDNGQRYNAISLNDGTMHLFQPEEFVHPVNAELVIV